MSDEPAGWPVAQSQTAASVAHGAATAATSPAGIGL